MIFRGASFAIWTNHLDADADRERGLDGGRYEHLIILKYCRFLQLDVELER